MKASGILSSCVAFAATVSASALRPRTEADPWIPIQLAMSGAPATFTRMGFGSVQYQNTSDATHVGFFQKGAGTDVATFSGEVSTGEFDGRIYDSTYPATKLLYLVDTGSTPEYIMYIAEESSVLNQDRVYYDDFMTIEGEDGSLLLGYDGVGGLEMWSACEVEQGSGEFFLFFGNVADPTSTDVCNIPFNLTVAYTGPHE